MHLVPPGTLLPASIHLACILEENTHTHTLYIFTWVYTEKMFLLKTYSTNTLGTHDWDKFVTPDQLATLLVLNDFVIHHTTDAGKEHARILLCAIKVYAFKRHICKYMITSQTRPMVRPSIGTKEERLINNKSWFSTM